MIKFILSISLSMLLFITLSSNALGNIQTKSCAKCSYLQMERMAKSLSKRRGSVSVIIMDYANEIPQKFDVFSSHDRRGEPVVNAYPVSLTQDEINDVNIIFEYRREMVKMLKAAEAKPPYDYRNFIVATQESSKELKDRKGKEHNTVQDTSPYYIVGRIKVNGNPVDYVSTKAYQNNTYDYYTSGYTSVFAEILSGITTKIDIPTMKDADLALEITFVETNDEGIEVQTGRAVVTIDFYKQTLPIVVLRDNANNNVPETINQVPGNYLFLNDDDSRQLVDYILDTWGGGGDSSSGCRVIKRQQVAGGVIYTFRC